MSGLIFDTDPESQPLSGPSYNHRGEDVFGRLPGRSSPNHANQGVTPARGKRNNKQVT